MWFWIFAAIVLIVGFVAFTGAPYVPSKRREVRRVLTKLCHLGAADTLVDLGSGDGIVLREASRLGAKAIGYEIHPLLVLIARLLSRGDTHVTVRQANFWRSHLPDDTTVVYLFGDGRDITKMFAYVEREVQRIGHPVRLLSYAFAVPTQPPKATYEAYYLYELKPLQD